MNAQETKSPAIDPTRVKILKLAFDAILDPLKGDTVQAVANPLPQDAICTGALYSQCDGSIALWVASNEFPVTDDDHRPETIDPPQLVRSNIADYQ
jgi:hypothetical protein